MQPGSVPALRWTTEIITVSHLGPTARIWWTETCARSA